MTKHFKLFLYIILLMSLPLSNGNVAQEAELPRAYIGEVVAEKMIARAMEKTREEVLEAYDAFGLDEGESLIFRKIRLRGFLLDLKAI